MVEANPEGNLGQVGITADGLDELVAGAYVVEVSYVYLVVSDC